MIKSPKRPKHDPHRSVECEIALDAAYLHLVSAAVEAGWSHEEATQAIAALGRGYHHARGRATVRREAGFAGRQTLN